MVMTRELMFLLVFLLSTPVSAMSPLSDSDLSNINTPPSLFLSTDLMEDINNEEKTLDNSDKVWSTSYYQVNKSVLNPNEETLTTGITNGPITGNTRYSLPNGTTFDTGSMNTIDSSGVNPENDDPTFGNYYIIPTSYTVPKSPTMNIRIH